MDYILKNNKLKVCVTSLGGGLKSIMDEDGIEYIWQGDKKYWAGQAPHLFPYVGRLTDGKYTFQGKEFEMGTHGFARFQEFDAKEEGNRIIFTLNDNDALKLQYPFSFCFSIIYELEGNVLKQTYRVKNTGNQNMYFAVGGHPGFNVPLEKGLSFEDYRLEFEHPASTWQVGMSDTCYVNGKDELFNLDEGRILPLRHELFNRDAIVLKHMDRSVKLYSNMGRKSVTVTYPNMPYLGLWHTPNTDAGFVCIEPWSAIPSRDGIVEELTQKADMISLKPGKEYENQWTILCK